MRVVYPVVLIGLASLCARGDWRPVTSAELAQKTPRLDPGADAEAIFWDVRIEDRFQGESLSLSMNHYVRIKIFTERGKEQYSTVEIPHTGKRSVVDVAARTIKPDGTTIDMKKDSVFERELVKTKGLKLRGITFALPNVEVGDIVEYRYREVRDNELASHMRLYFQRDLPTWEVAYHLKPLDIPWLPFAMRAMSFQCDLPPFEKEPNGFVRMAMSKVPAFRPEPDMPPQDALRWWALIYYEEDKKIDAQKFWKETGKQDFARFKPLIKAGNNVKSMASELISGIQSEDDQLHAIDTFCRTKIRNLSLSKNELNSDERRAIKENKSPADTLKQMAGTSIDVDLLFAALANAAGFDARIARIPDRGDTFFSIHQPTTYFLDNFSVAVKRGEDKWAFFDPSSRFLDRGMLRWQEEGQMALVSDPKEGFFTKTQYSEPGRSVRRRRANLKLQEDGTIEGTLEYTYTGHAARSQKLRLDRLSPADREKDWKESLQARMSTAEMSDFRAEAVSEDDKPLVIRHKVSVPGYGTRTGKRILIQPAFFQFNMAPRFSETTRRHPLYFEYGWAEDDQVIIELPEGWTFDNPVLPQSSEFRPIGNYSVQVMKSTDNRKIIYRRQFDWGRNMAILIPAVNYPQIKNVFNFIHEQDNYTLSLKPGGVKDAK